MIKKLYIVLVISAIVLLIAAQMGEDSVYLNNADIIKFSHAKHVELTACADCHLTVPESTSLNDRLLPDHESCSACHSVEDTKECGTCHTSGDYQPLVQKKSQLIFNHKNHVGLKAECIDCHKGLDKVDYGFESADTYPSMQTCYTCHNETKTASNACESCHTTNFNLLPQSHSSNNFLESHKFMARDRNADCMMCHNNNSCQECHSATTGISEGNTAYDFYTPYMPSDLTDKAKGQTILKVHGDFNYRFSHGIDAAGKTIECQSCHQVETFCASCHNSQNNDFALSGILPASHLLPDFKTIGAGSGGGEHAVLARRNIEQCISCHDVQGADPTCIFCHLDSDGIKGTNPKTHTVNFMRNEYGDWHEDANSVCYNCHTSQSPSTPSGMGFCGYCHNAN